MDGKRFFCGYRDKYEMLLKFLHLLPRMYLLAHALDACWPNYCCLQNIFAKNILAVNCLREIKFAAARQTQYPAQCGVDAKNDIASTLETHSIFPYGNIQVSICLFLMQHSFQRAASLRVPGSVCDLWQSFRMSCVTQCEQIGMKGGEGGRQAKKTGLSIVFTV